MNDQHRALPALWTAARPAAASSALLAFAGPCGWPPCEISVFHAHLACRACRTIGDARCDACRATAWSEISHRHDAFVATAGLWRWRRN